MIKSIKNERKKTKIKLRKRVMETIQLIKTLLIKKLSLK